eukprot:m.232505 g.232505  ORF g.232505 m.232505 type:complete len:85 (+) comp19277_c0_seq2:1194-1448(+)
MVPNDSQREGELALRQLVPASHATTVQRLPLEASWRPTRCQTQLAVPTLSRANYNSCLTHTASLKKPPSKKDHGTDFVRRLFRL